MQERTLGSVLNSLTCRSLKLRHIDPSSLLNCISFLFSESCSKSNMPVHWEKTIALTGSAMLGIDSVVSPTVRAGVLMIELSISTAARIFEEM